MDEALVYVTIGIERATGLLLRERGLIDGEPPTIRIRWPSCGPATPSVGDLAVFAPADDFPLRVLHKKWVFVSETEARCEIVLGSAA